jgi:hypothetical protein
MPIDWAKVEPRKKTASFDIQTAEQVPEEILEKYADYSERGRAIAISRDLGDDYVVRKVGGTLYAIPK